MTPPPSLSSRDAPTVWVCHLLKEIGFAKSMSDARRLVGQGAVRVGDVPVDLEFQFEPGATYLVGVGRRRLASVNVVPRAPA